MKKINLILVCVVLAVYAKAQAPDLSQINASAKTNYVKVEELDKFQQALNYFDQHPLTGKEQQNLLLATYRAIADGYTANNHYKQGYGVFQKYLTIKEGFLAAEKAAAMEKVNRELDDKRKKDEDERAGLKNEISQLRSDNNGLQLKTKSFRNYFSMGVITLTVILAFFLLQAALKLNRIRMDLKAGRERLMFIHRVASLGRLKEGILITVKKTFSSLKGNSANAIAQSDEFAKLSGEKNSDLSQLKKQLQEVSRVATQAG